MEDKLLHCAHIYLLNVATLFKLSLYLLTYIHIVWMGVDEDSEQKKTLALMDTLVWASK